MNPWISKEEHEIAEGWLMRERRKGGETYEQFMERRVRELVGNEASATQFEKARNAAQAEWAQR